MELLKSQDIRLPKNVPLDMRKWRAIVNAWDASQENQKAYCQRIGVSFNTFSYVRSKLANKEKTKFIPMTISRSETPKIENQCVLILESPDGFKLHFPSSLSLDQLAKLFKLSGWQND